MTITGIVETGRGGASRIPDDMFERRRQAAGGSLVRGTMNVRVPDLAGAVAALGTPDFETDKSDHKGSLQWWRVTLRCTALPDGEAGVFVVRQSRTRTDYLEVMGNMRFRDAGVKDGAEVSIQREVQS